MPARPPLRAGRAQVLSDAGMWGIVAGAVLLVIVLAIAGAAVGEAMVGQAMVGQAGTMARLPIPLTDRI
jgi:hypothetical protein